MEVHRRHCGGFRINRDNLLLAELAAVILLPAESNRIFDEETQEVTPCSMPMFLHSFIGESESKIVDRGLIDDILVPRKLELLHTNLQIRDTGRLYSQTITMSASREGPNPLRPYYIPPSIGPPPDVTGAASSASHTFSNRNGTAPTYASSARDIFSDIDYSDYVPEGSLSTVDMIKELLDQALYKYTSVLLAQPFEVAKTVLQVRSQAAGDGSIPIADTDEMREGSSSYRESRYGDVSDYYPDFPITC